jgi:hypothetical protein
LTDRPSVRSRVAIALAAALVALIYVHGSWLVWDGYSTDFDVLWRSARVLLSSGDPYSAIRAFNTQHGVEWGLLYPLPAVLVAVPLADVELPWARAIVAAIGAFSIAFLITRDSWAKLPILFSAAFRSSVSLVQLTPFVACAAISPWFGWSLAVKPHSGILVLLAQRSRRDVVLLGVAAIVVGLGSLVVFPRWPVSWYEAVAASDYHEPLVVRPGGVLLLLAALRWRRPEARWLMGIALLPSTPNIYDALPLLAVMPLTFRQALMLGILSHVADISAYAFRADQTFAALQRANGITLIWLFYFPVLFLVLKRPNADTKTGHSWYGGNS